MGSCLSRGTATETVQTRTTGEFLLELVPHTRIEDIGTLYETEEKLGEGVTCVAPATDLELYHP